MILLEKFSDYSRFVDKKAFIKILLFAVVHHGAVNDVSNQTGQSISPLIELHELVHLQLASVHTDPNHVDFLEHFVREAYKCLLSFGGLECTEARPRPSTKPTNRSETNKKLADRFGGTLKIFL